MEKEVWSSKFDQSYLIACGNSHGQYMIQIIILKLKESSVVYVAILFQNKLAPKLANN